MDNDLIAKASITIEVPGAKVWKALVDPAAIEQYMFGTHAVSDWHAGSPIIWEGQWQGRQYQDKGVILQFKPELLLQYSHFSPRSGLPDETENYHTVTIELLEAGKQTRVTLAQDHNSTEQDRKHSEQNWGMMLTSLKKYLER
jgi:uncharacterized protein YndB with AHSA1/START domain